MRFRISPFDSYEYEHASTVTASMTVLDKVLFSELLAYPNDIAGMQRLRVRC
jgi:hypothetical protein